MINYKINEENAIYQWIDNELSSAFSALTGNYALSGTNNENMYTEKKFTKKKEN